MINEIMMSMADWLSPLFPDFKVECGEPDATSLDACITLKSRQYYRAIAYLDMENEFVRVGRPVWGISEYGVPHTTFHRTLDMYRVSYEDPDMSDIILGHLNMAVHAWVQICSQDKSEVGQVSIRETV